MNTPLGSLKNTERPGRTRSRPPRMFSPRSAKMSAPWRCITMPSGSGSSNAWSISFLSASVLAFERRRVFDGDVRRELLARSHAVEVALQERNVDEGVGGDRQRSLQVGDAQLAHFERREREHGARGAADGARHRRDPRIRERGLEPAVLVAEAHAAEILLHQRAREARAVLGVVGPLLLGRARVDPGVRRRLLGLGHELAPLERELHVGVEADLAVRGERLRAPELAAVFQAERGLLLVARRAGKIARP